MSKRNVILLIIILIFAIGGFYAFLYFQNTNPTTPRDEGFGTNFFSQFNPFGKSANKPPVVTPPVDVSGYVPPEEEEVVKSKLVKVSSMPIAGFTVFSKERLKEILVTDPIVTPTKTQKTLTEFALSLRYVEKATGNIYQTFVDKLEEHKLSGTIIPKVYDAYFGNRAESVIMRYLKNDDRTIETFVGVLPKEFLGADINKLNEIKGVFLPDNVRNISISPDGLKIFYLFNSGDNMVGATMNLLTNKKVQIFDSPFTEWLSGWGSTNIITISTKPSAGIPGYAYNMDTNGKNLTKILGDINGLTTLGSPDGKLVLYDNGNLALSIYHTDTKVSDLLGIRTLPEKCVWNKMGDTIYCAVPKGTPGSTYPDSWYQGEVSFNDQIWKIDVKTGNATLVAGPSAVTIEEIDGISLALDEGENYLFFVNKKDSFLWKLELK